MLASDGWSRSDPADGAPQWYTTNTPAGDPMFGCLSKNFGAWQSTRFDLFATPNCSLPSATQVVLTKTVGPRVFVARLNVNGMTVDAAHKHDRGAVRSIQREQLTEPPDDE